MSAPPSAIASLTSPDAVQTPGLPRSARQRPDAWMLAGIAIAFGAMAAGIGLAKIPLSYFLQPSGIVIVLGGTLGATVVTTPRRALAEAVRRVAGLWWEDTGDTAELVDELMSYVRQARVKGLLSIEPAVRESRHEFLRECVTLALDVQKNELQPAMETRMRLRERRGDADARTLEIAGGFAPTIGVLGTVVGLIDVLRRFSDLTAVAGGVGTAFASTLYGIGVANLVLLPLAHRIRASVAAGLEKDELILEGVGCLLDGVHPALAKERLQAFLDHRRAA